MDVQFAVSDLVNGNAVSYDRKQDQPHKQSYMYTYSVKSRSFVVLLHV